MLDDARQRGVQYPVRAEEMRVGDWPACSERTNEDTHDSHDGDRCCRMLRLRRRKVVCTPRNGPSNSHRRCPPAERARATGACGRTHANHQPLPHATPIQDDSPSPTHRSCEPTGVIVGATRSPRPRPQCHNGSVGPCQMSARFGILTTLLVASRGRPCSGSVPCLWLLANLSVCVFSIINGQHKHNPLVLVDGVENPVRTRSVTPRWGRAAL